MGSNCDQPTLATLDDGGHDSSDPIDGFYCDHIVLDLFGMGIRESRGALQLKHKEVATIRKKVHRAVRQMPRGV
jgi:hypothetical protein